LVYNRLQTQNFQIKQRIPLQETNTNNRPPADIAGQETEGKNCSASSCEHIITPKERVAPPKILRHWFLIYF
jgi:hypothetical protein